MDNQTLIEYAPLIIVLLAFFWQNNVFVKPEQLEKKHREILKDIDRKYATKDEINNVKDDFNEVKEKIDKIYNKIFNIE